MKFDPIKDVIAAYRYLAFLEAERRALIADMGIPSPDGYFIPFDTQIDALQRAAPPLARAEQVLSALGVDPAQEEGWTDLLGSWPQVTP